MYLTYTGRQCRSNIGKLIQKTSKNKQKSIKSIDNIKLIPLKHNLIFFKVWKLVYWILFWLVDAIFVYKE